MLALILTKDKGRRTKDKSSLHPSSFALRLRRRRGQGNVHTAFTSSHPYGIMKAAEVAMYGLAVLTVSTSGYHGQREDTSGQAIKEVLGPPDYEVVRYEIVSDE